MALYAPPPPPMPLAAAQPAVVSDAASAAAAGAGGAAAAPPPPDTSSFAPCVCISNLFDPKEETEPGWDTDIRDEVAEECAKVGGGGGGGGGGSAKVVHAATDKDDPQGCVYVLFDPYAQGAEAAQAAVAALEGRKFGGRKISARALQLAEYFARWPEAAERIR